MSYFEDVLQWARREDLELWSEMQHLRKMTKRSLAMMPLLPQQASSTAIAVRAAIEIVDLRKRIKELEESGASAKQRRGGFEEY